MVPHGCALPAELFPDWARDFGRAAAIELEIGPGRGGFALGHAAAHPEADLVCIETRRSDCTARRFCRMRRRLRHSHPSAGSELRSIVSTAPMAMRSRASSNGALRIAR